MATQTSFKHHTTASIIMTLNKNNLRNESPGELINGGHLQILFTHWSLKSCKQQYLWALGKGWCHEVRTKLQAASNARLADVITIVAMFTIVAINHNCRNTNHNCRKNPQLSQCQRELSQSCSITIVATPITNVAIFALKPILRKLCDFHEYTYLVECCRLFKSKTHFNQW